MPTSANWLPPLKTSLWMKTSPSWTSSPNSSIIARSEGAAPKAMIEANSVCARVRPSRSKITVTKSPISLKIGERELRIRTVAISRETATTRRCSTEARIGSGANCSAAAAAGVTWCSRSALAGDKGEDALGAAGAVDQLQRGDDDQRAGGGQLRQVGQLGEAVAARAEEEVVDREARVHPTGGAGVDADRLAAVADDVGVLGQPFRAGDVRAGAGRALGAEGQERGLVLGARFPTGAEEDPAAGGDLAVLGLEGVEVRGGQQVAVVGLDLGGLVDDDGGADQLRRRDRGDVDAVFAGDPMDRRVEVGAGVLAELEDAPGPGGAKVVVVAELLAREVRRVRERVRQDEDRGALAQRLGEVDDLDLTGSEGGDQIGDGGVGHRCSSLSG